MKKFKIGLALLVLAMTGTSYAQGNHNTSMPGTNPKLIAVVNRADWCAVCKANGMRFAHILMPYAAKGVNIYMNDLTNDSTRAVSRAELKKAGVGDALNSAPRRGMGKMLQSCGMAGAKKQTEVSGIVTFVDPGTHKQLKQLSIAASDEEMTAAIDNLLK